MQHLDLLKIQGKNVFRKEQIVPSIATNIPPLIYHYGNYGSFLQSQKRQFLVSSTQI